MKYTINGFSQAMLVELGLNSNDSLILRWFVDFQNTGKMRKEVWNGSTYYWVIYQSIINDLPILSVTSRKSIARTFEKFERCGLMKKYVKKEGGTFTCFSIVGDVYLTLIDGGGQICPAGVDNNVQPGVDNNVQTKDSSTKVDNSIKKTSKEVLDFLNDTTGKNYRTTKHIEARLKSYTKEDLKKIVTTMDSHWRGTEYEQYLQPSTLFGSDEKVDKYLNKRPRFTVVKKPTMAFDEETAKFLGLNNG